MLKTQLSVSIVQLLYIYNRMYEYTFVREIKKGSNYILVFGIQQKLEKNRHKWATKKKKNQ